MNSPAEPPPPSGIEHLLRPTRPRLKAAFAPKSIAVIGAGETHGSVGRTLMENLAAFQGSVYPVNPAHSTVLGTKTFPAIGAVPAAIDLAVIATPASTVPDIVRQCAEAKVAMAVIISAGFKECGAAGATLEARIAAARGEMRVLGPNCLGLMVPYRGLNATFAGTMAKDGNVAFISQSGALCTAILDWSRQQNIGFSAFISTGSMVDVDWGDLIYHLGDDFRTQSILLYMETIGNARSFLSAAREVALSKPIIVLKVGRTAAAAQAVISHTGALAGSDEALEAAFRRAGVLRVDTIAELFSLAEVLGQQPRPPGPRLAIVTNGGGPGALAVDALLGAGGTLAPLSETTLTTLDSFLPPFWSKHNPVDVLGDADAGRFARAVQEVSRDPAIDGVLAILTPQAMTEPLETANQLKVLAKMGRKPLLACWMGGQEVAEGERTLHQAGIPTFRYPDAAARAFCSLWRYSQNLSALYETPALRVGPAETADASHAGSIISRAYAAGRVLLTEVESKQLLEAYGIPTVPTRIAQGEQAAADLIAAFDGPVVLKVLSEIVTHKSDFGGVKLDLRDGEAVRQAYRDIERAVAQRYGTDAFLGVTVQPMIAEDGYELLLGSATDPQLGPVVVFGAGGRLVEVIKDRALGLPPLNATLARRLVERCRIYRALQGIRGGKAINFAELETVLIRFGRLVAEQRRIKEIDVNPLLASAAGLIALDARVVLHDPSLTDDQLPKLAIRPYPTEYIFQQKLKDGTPVTLRPICPEDEPLVAEFHKTLSDETVHYRYFTFLKLESRIAHDRLRRICFNDYDREIALVAERELPETQAREVVGIGRLIKSYGLSEAEFAIVISDAWQGHGLGTELLRRLLQIGRHEGMDRIIGYILPDNYPMRQVCEKLGFSLGYDAESEAYKAIINLTPNHHENHN